MENKAGNKAGLTGFSRRSVLGGVASAGAISLGACVTDRSGEQAALDEMLPAERARQLQAAADRLVLDTARLPDPVVIASIELLRSGKQYFVRLRDADGATGIALCNPSRMNTLWPIFLSRVAPTYLGKDARDLEAIQLENLTYQLNYKWQGLAYWCCVAWMEFAVLDLLGQRTRLPVSDLLGGRVRQSSGIYYASSNRGNSPEAEIAHLEALASEAGARALKIRLGARLKRTEESDARDLALIPAVRDRFGAGTVLYADANSSYDVPRALEIGRLLEQQDYGFFEEPVMFDHYDETRSVAEGLRIPIAFGEQEASLRRFRWLLEHDAAQVMQPDLLYFGGLIRAIKVARMAAVRGYPAVPHMSGGGLGSLYVMHFASVVANTTDFQEYKGKETVPYVVSGTDAPMQPVNGRVDIPAGPGLGVSFDPDLLSNAVEVTLGGA